MTTSDSVERSVPITSAFWLHGRDIHPVSTTHISFVFENPGTFGFTRDELVAAYNEASEPLRFEGRARQEIMRRALRSGWIRIRHSRNRNADRWIMQMEDRSAEEHARAFISWAERTGLVSNGERFRLDYLSS